MASDRGQRRGWRAAWAQTYIWPQRPFADSVFNLTHPWPSRSPRGGPGSAPSGCASGTAHPHRPPPARGSQLRSRHRLCDHKQVLTLAAAAPCSSRASSPQAGRQPLSSCPLSYPLTRAQVCMTDRAHLLFSQSLTMARLSTCFHPPPATASRYASLPSSPLPAAHHGQVVHLLPVHAHRGQVRLDVVLHAALRDIVGRSSGVTEEQ